MHDSELLGSDQGVRQSGGSPSAGWFQDDEVLLQEAARKRIPVAALIHGWDHASSKGYRAVKPEVVLAWSDDMRDQLVDLQDIAPERVRVSGVPHWDHYFRPGELPSRVEFFSELGLDPDRRLLVYAPPTTKRFHDGSVFEELRMIERLVRAVEHDEFGPMTQLVIRAHPKTMTPQAAGRHAAIDAAVSQARHVHMNYPRLLSPDLHDHFAPDDAHFLGGLMKHCDVLINMFSTTTLEAIANDRPVVMIGRSAYLPHTERKEQWTVDFDWEAFEHLRPVVDNQAARTARCWHELVAAVSTYLEDPSRDREGRKRVTEAALGPLDGRSGWRAATSLLEILGIDSSPKPRSLGLGLGDDHPAESSQRVGVTGAVGPPS